MSEQELTIYEAADAFSELLNDDGNIKDDAELEAAKPEPKESEEPKKEAEPEEEAEEKDGAEDKEPEDEESEESEEKPEPKVYKVKVDGQELEVDENELVQGYQRQADYTRKTQAVAAKERELAEYIPQAVKQATGQYEQAIDKLMGLVGEQYNQVSQTDMRKLLDEDPIQYMKIQQEQAERQQALNLYNAQKKAADEANTISTYHRESQALLEKIPEWQDEKVASAEKAELGASLLASGFTQAEVSHLLDHRSVMIARKAMLYDKLMQTKTAVKEKLDKTPVKVEKAGSRPALQSNSRKGLEQRLAKTGKIDDAAALFSSYL